MKYIKKNWELKIVNNIAYIIDCKTKNKVRGFLYSIECDDIHGSLDEYKKLMCRLCKYSNSCVLGYHPIKVTKFYYVYYYCRYFGLYLGVVNEMS
jgi:hypothetical protein